MHFTYDIDEGEMTIHGARPYLPNRDRVVYSPDTKEASLQSDLILMVQLPDSVEVWEIESEKIIPEVLKYYEQVETILAWSAARLLAVFQPIR